MSDFDMTWREVVGGIIAAVAIWGFLVVVFTIGAPLVAR